MGLDNGISIKRTSFSSTLEELKQFETIYDKEHEYDFSICYWRKCWNVRNRILNALYILEPNDSYTILSIDDIDTIIDILKSFNSENWDDYGGSIWDWTDGIDEKMQYDIANLEQLKIIKERYENSIEIYFYNSW